MFVINGQPAENLAVTDRSIQFGDGCFTTARVVNGRVQLLEMHLQRLQKTCDVLMIPFTAWSDLRQEMQTIARADNTGVVKVILTRGAGSRGYGLAGCHTPTRIVSGTPAPTHYATWRQHGITLSQSSVRLGRNPLLAGLKHLNRLEQVLIRAHLEQTNADEALVLDSEGWLTECCAANLFWRRGMDVFTPCLDQAGVNGIMRQHILRQLAASPYRVAEVAARLETLVDADEVFICNALMPIVPVQKFEGQRWPSRELYQYLAPLCELSD